MAVVVEKEEDEEERRVEEHHVYLPPYLPNITNLPTLPTYLDRYLPTLPTYLPPCVITVHPEALILAVGATQSSGQERQLN